MMSDQVYNILETWVGGGGKCQETGLLSYYSTLPSYAFCSYHYLVPSQTLLTRLILVSVTLWDKVGKVSQEPNLAALVKPEWVTVRNVIAHGRALFIPSETGIRFPDRKRIVFWTLARAYLEAVDIYLANQAMLRIWNIVQIAGLTDFIEQLTQLRVLAQQ